MGAPSQHRVIKFTFYYELYCPDTGGSYQIPFAYPPYICPDCATRFHQLDLEHLAERESAERNKPPCGNKVKKAFEELKQYHFGEGFQGVGDKYNIPPPPPPIKVCECGGTKLNMTHSTWCPLFK